MSHDLQFWFAAIGAVAAVMFIASELRKWWPF
jgi:hypothetical protein